MNPINARKLQLIAESDKSRELLLVQASVLKSEVIAFSQHTRKVALISAAAVGIVLTIWMVRRYRSR